MVKMLLPLKRTITLSQGQKHYPYTLFIIQFVFNFYCEYTKSSRPMCTYNIGMAPNPYWIDALDQCMPIFFYGMTIGRAHGLLCLEY